ncbi:MAG: AAA family ATPase [Magnetospirillum gryphiswaldense]|nr:AAA family ATPase [Magnetospirillum gryphiswaldense]
MPKDDTTGKGQNTTNSADPVAFLRDFDPEGRFNLVAIDPETAFVTGRTFRPKAWDEMRTWVAERNGRQNLYFTVNEPHPTAPDKKLLKDDIATIRAVYVDADPIKDKPFDDERRRLLDLARATQSSPCPPTFVVDSGGGVQFFWRLAEKLPASEHRQWAEEQGRGLAHAVGGDAVQNIDRIMRLPGTVNIPDAKKRARGRTEAGARLFAASSAAYTPGALSSYAAPRSPDSDNLDSAEDIAAIQRTLDMHAIAAGPDQHLLARLATSALADPRLQAILDGKPLKGEDQSGSAYRAALVARLCENGSFTPTEYAAVAAKHPQCNVNLEKDVPGGWPRQFARDWCKIGMKHAVEHWLQPIEEDEPSPFDVQHAKQTEQEREEARIAWEDPSDWDYETTPPTDWVVDGMIPRGEITLLLGTGGTGKTLLAMQMATGLAAGTSVLGRPVKKQKVMLFLCEDSADELKRRQRSIDASLGLHRGNYKGHLRTVSRKFEDNALFTWDNRANTFNLTPLWHSMRNDATAFGADLIVIDTLADVFGGSEIDKQQVRKFLNVCLGKLVESTGGAVLLLGHPSQSGMASGEGTSGSRSWHDTVRSRFYFERATKDRKDAKRKLTNMKSQYGQDGDQYLLEWRKGAFDLIMSSTAQPVTQHGVRDMVVELDACVIDAVQRFQAEGVSSSNNSRAGNYLPPLIKRQFADKTAVCKTDEIEACVTRLEACGKIRFGQVGRKANRHAINGYVVCEVVGVFG